MAAVFGADAMVQVFSGTTSLGTVNGAGMTSAQIADAIRIIFQNSAAWNASGLTGTTFTVTSNHVGTTPAARLLVIPGSTPDNEGNLTPGTLDVAQVVVNDGETTTVTGTPTTLTITVGTTNTPLVLSSGSNASDTATAIVAAINSSVSEYNSSVNGNVVRATSIRRTDETDITIAVTTAGTSGTVAIARNLIIQGASPTFDLTGASWEYGIFNQEVRVDDDTVTMDADNDIMVRRGLVLDTDVVEGLTPLITTAIAPRTGGSTVTTGTRPSQFVIIGNILVTVTLGVTTANNGTRIQGLLQFTTDGGTTWSNLGTTLNYRVRGVLPAGHNGQVVSTTLPVAETVRATASTTYDFRVVMQFLDDTGTALTSIPTNIGYSGFAWNALYIEELLAA